MPVEIIAIAIAACALLFFFLERAKRNRREREIEALTEEMRRFVLYPENPMEENLEEGCLANLSNQISELEQHFLHVSEMAAKREQEMVSFVENMAHQMENVLTALQLQLDLLQARDDGTQQEGLGKCQNCVDRLTWETERILKSSQLAAGKIPMIREELDLGEEIEKIIAHISPIAEASDVTVQTDVPGKMIYEGDPFWLPQAVENVIKNAIEHTAPGSDVTVRLADKTREICIRIEDEGEGIPEEELSSLFRRFSRGRVSKAGYGIGLSMAKDVIEIHHGSIQAGNRTTSGAWFEIRLRKLSGAQTYQANSFRQ